MSLTGRENNTTRRGVGLSTPGEIGPHPKLVPGVSLFLAIPPNPPVFTTRLLQLNFAVIAPKVARLPVG